VWRTRKSRIGNASVEAKTDGVKASVRVTEYLIEVADTHRDLVGHRRGNDVVPDDGIVLNVDRSVLKVWRQVGAGGGSLRALRDEPSGGEMVFVCDCVVQFDKSVKAMAGQVAGGLIVLWICSSVESIGRPEASKSAVSVQQIWSYWAVGNTVKIKDTVSLGLIGG